MKHIDLKISFYTKKFGLGTHIEKMPMVFPYAYKLTIQVAWIECCLFFYFKPNSWNR